MFHSKVNEINVLVWVRSDLKTTRKNFLVGFSGRQINSEKKLDILKVMKHS